MKGCFFPSIRMLTFVEQQFSLWLCCCYTQHWEAQKTRSNADHRTQIQASPSQCSIKRSLVPPAPAAPLKDTEEKCRGGLVLLLLPCPHSSHGLEQVQRVQVPLFYPRADRRLPVLPGNPNLQPFSSVHFEVEEFPWTSLNKRFYKGNKKKANNIPMSSQRSVDRSLHCI